MSSQLFAATNIIVTGANGGIGWATCEVLAMNGANVITTTRTSSNDFLSKLEALGASNGVRCSNVTLDLSDTDSVKSALLEVRRVGEIGGLVNNAGLTLNSLFQMTSPSVTRELFEVNTFGLFNFTQGCVRMMLRQGNGAIVNVASTAGIDGNLGRSAYGASKASVMTWSRSLARELAPHGIRVNAVAPGVTATAMLDSMSKEVLLEVEETTDLGRSAHPSEIAEAICFLLSPLSSYVTGQTIRVDGGMRS